MIAGHLAARGRSKWFAVPDWCGFTVHNLLFRSRKSAKIAKALEGAVNNVLDEFRGSDEDFLSDDGRPARPVPPPKKK